MSTCIGNYQWISILPVLIMPTPEKAALIDLSFRSNVFGYIFTFLFLAMIFLDIRYEFQARTKWLPLFIGIGMIGLFVDRFLLFRRLRVLHFPAYYLQAFRLSALLQLFRFLWCYYGSFTFRNNLIL